MTPAIGPIRSRLYQLSPHLEEAARSLGSSPLHAFGRITLPLLFNPMLASASFVFLSAIKELPLTLVLAPPGFRTLAGKTFDAIEEARFAEAAPYALTLLAFSVLFVSALLYRERE
jgi:iron(III) transport system permease protein